MEQHQQSALKELRRRQHDILRREREFAAEQSGTEMKDEGEVLIAYTPSPTTTAKSGDHHQWDAQRTAVCLFGEEGEEEEAAEVDEAGGQDQETGFVFDDELGYIASNPQYFGIDRNGGLRHVENLKLPNLIKHEKFNDILEIRNLTAYQHDVDSAQQMFMAYSAIKERRNSASNPRVITSNTPRCRPN